MCLNNGVDKSKPKPVTRWLLPFHKTLEGPVPDIGRKTRTVVGDNSSATPS